jgi:hypothetical protein
VRRLLVLTALAVGGSAFGLDKQGSAHGGEVDGAAAGFDLTGSLMVGVALYNPSYAARPDNTGITLMRYGAHLDVDLIGRLLSVPIDVNLFTDRLRGGLAVFAPTELDLITGVTSTFSLGPGALELGARVEHDRPVDQGTFTQTYVDGRARFLYSAASTFPSLADALRGGDLSGWVTLGGFFYNPTYAARPDNTGFALLRYGLHGELSTFDDLFSLGLDATMFTDREVNAVRPSELDFTVDFIFHKEPFEVHLAYERDMPVDRPGLVQQLVYLLVGWSFDLVNNAPLPAVTTKNPVVSP